MYVIQKDNVFFMCHPTHTWIKAHILLINFSQTQEVKSKKEDELKFTIETIAIVKQTHHPAITSKLSVNFAKIHKFNKHKHGKIVGPFQKFFST